MLIIRRSNCINISGIVLSVSDRPVCRLRRNWLNHFLLNLHTGRSLTESTIPDAVLIQFHENPSRGELFHAGKRTDMVKLIVPLRNFANAPKNECTGTNPENWAPIKHGVISQKNWIFKIIVVMKHTNTSFTKPDNSAACSQDPTTGPYPVHTFL